VIKAECAQGGTITPGMSGSTLGPAGVKGPSGEEATPCIRAEFVVQLERVQWPSMNEK
jgi:hypothetical protein